MAQSSAGITLHYTGGVTKEADGTYKLPTSLNWKKIPDVTSIPALKGDPNMLDTTVLSETKQKTYIAGLADNGGSMSFNVQLTPELVDAINGNSGAYETWSTGIAQSNPTYMAFAISFPKPLNRYYWYVGAPQKVLPGEAEVDAVLSSTFDTSMESAVTEVTGAIV